jgi:hypothetical protein
MNDHGQPIQDWLKAQRGLNADDREALAAIVGVWTLGDLLTVLERGEVAKELASKARKVLERERPHDQDQS